jgi:3-hydroxybutyrate dehydrogenase
VIFRRADMSKPDDIRAMMEAVVDELGPIDILVNNAGVQHVAPIQDFSSEAWDMVLATNLSSAFHCTKAVLPAMKKRGWGRIINVASAHGLVASPFKSAYVAAKHGMLGDQGSGEAEEGSPVTPSAPAMLDAVIEKQIEDQARSHGIAQAGS